jgi:phospho-N-acetylmuramoyl-pentapeptide-transferase
MDTNSLISWIPMIAMVGFGAIGLFDDMDKLKRGNAYGGLSQLGRLIAEGFIAVVLAFLIDSAMPAYVPSLSIIAPLGIVLPVGMLYFVWSYFVIVGTANATNLTDGLDGLLSKVFLTIMVVMIIALVGITRAGFMPNLLFLPETASLFPCFGAVMGSVLGFLWFNSKPASIFMGDVGSLALGGFLGSSALLMKSEIIMAVAGFVMVIMVISSFMQMMYYKFVAPRGKAPFLMAPLHHHYEMKGFPETKITERLFIVSIISAGIAIALLKL